MNESNNTVIEYKGWHVVRRIGTGSFGSVYEIEREDFGYTYKAALKVISIPKSDQDLTAAKNNIGKSDDSLAVYYQSVASEIVKEFELMYQLRGTTNIVSYEDHEVRKHDSGIGWDIMIRMELLTPLDIYTKEHVMNRQDIIRLGIDICKALERCRALDIIHRDIKPGNIFISEQGDFKLGDFGIARTIEAHDEVLELSRKGTISYMAPEIFKGMKYSFDVDIYSLGVVMYRLLNNNILPFMPQPPEKPTYKDVSNANQLRLSGKPLPYPAEDHTQLADIVMKACSYRPEERYQDPGIMREHLEKVLKGEQIDEFDNETVLLEPSENLSGSENKNTGRSTGKNKSKKGLIIPLVIIIVLASAIIGMVMQQKKKDSATERVVESLETQLAEEKSGTVVVKETEQGLQNLIENKNFVQAYKVIQDRTQNGENLDSAIMDFVRACEPESEYKRMVAIMRLLSDEISNNESFYRETVQWLYDHDKEEYVRQILTDLRAKGDTGEKLADSISSDYEK